METWTKTCRPIPGGFILTHTQVELQALCLKLERWQTYSWTFFPKSGQLASSDAFCLGKDIWNGTKEKNPDIVADNWGLRIWGLRCVGTHCVNMKNVLTMGITTFHVHNAALCSNSERDCTSCIVCCQT